MEARVAESVEGRETHRDDAARFEAGAAVDARFGDRVTAGLAYYRGFGTVETPAPPVEWGLGSNEFSAFVELRHRLAAGHRREPALGLGAAVGRLSLDGSIDIGSSIAETDLSGSATTARIYGFGTLALHPRLRLQLDAGYRFGSVSDDELEYGFVWTDEQGRELTHAIDLESGFLSLALTTVIWSAH